MKQICTEYQENFHIPMAFMSTKWEKTQFAKFIDAFKLKALTELTHLQSKKHKNKQ